VTPDIAHQIATAYFAELRAAPARDRPRICEAFRKRLRDSLIVVRDTEIRNTRKNHAAIERAFWPATRRDSKRPKRRGIRAGCVVRITTSAPTKKNTSNDYLYNVSSKEGRPENHRRPPLQ
jgi:hypothetical protein